jgi:hypothetical protein
VVVLVDRNRLQKSTGGAWPLATVDEESADPTMGLAPSRESDERVKECRKPDRRWQNREIGGGLPQIGEQLRKRRSWGHLSRKGALGRDKPLALT